MRHYTIDPMPAKAELGHKNTNKPVFLCPLSAEMISQSIITDPDHGLKRMAKITVCR